jgi:hypothetical protein
MRIKEYFLALQPRRMIWFVLQVLFLLATTATLIFTAAGIQPWWFKGTSMLALELSVIAVVLFFSGLIAWGKEKTDKDNIKAILDARWPKLTAAQREVLANSLGPFDVFPEIRIFRNNTENCRYFAADLCVAIESAMSGRGCMIPVGSAPRHIESGIVIVSRLNDGRARRLPTALEEIAKVEAVLSQREDSPFEIHIGARAL